jgi:two-component system, cell cycle response regulator DivK
MTNRSRGSSPSLNNVVLLVQPERDDREMYAEYLCHEGLVPICVQEANAALRFAPRANVIVAALLLPGSINGCELIRRLKRDVTTNRIPIVVLTVCAWSTEQAAAWDAGCDAFLFKPCLPKVLLREIRRMLRRSTPSAGTNTQRHNGSNAPSRPWTRNHAQSAAESPKPLKAECT